MGSDFHASEPQRSQVDLWGVLCAISFREMRHPSLSSETDLDSNHIYECHGSGQLEISSNDGYVPS